MTKHVMSDVFLRMLAFGLSCHLSDFWMTVFMHWRHFCGIHHHLSALLNSVPTTLVVLVQQLVCFCVCVCAWTISFKQNDTCYILGMLVHFDLCRSGFYVKITVVDGEKFTWGKNLWHQTACTVYCVHHWGMLNTARALLATVLQPACYHIFLYLVFFILEFLMLKSLLKHQMRAFLVLLPLSEFRGVNERKCTVPEMLFL